MRVEELEERTKEQGKGVHYVAEVRNGMVEGLHRVHIAVVNSGGKLLFSSGDPYLVTYSRSCIKPIQALPLLIRGAADRYGLSGREIAIICGSHSGQNDHLAAVRSVLDKGGLEEKMLKCKGHKPFDKQTATKIGEGYTPLHDNCSGKHAGALLLSKYMGWDLESYLDPEHPIQKEILEVITSLTGMDADDIHLGTDGCDIPNHAFPLNKMAMMFALLIEPSDHVLEPHLRRIGRAMLDHPFMVGGEKRFDTVIMRDNGGSILSKAGAAGLQTVAVRRKEDTIGISLKIEDGAYSPIPPLTYSILRELGVGVESSERGDEFALGPIKTRSKKVVGSNVVVGEMVEHI
ncbi:MAG: asparaginase [Thermoplasmatota archaeon]